MAAGPTALADEHERVGIRRRAEDHVVDEALPSLMPQFHPPFFHLRDGQRRFFAFSTVHVTPR